MRKLSELALKIAATQLHVREKTNNNDGPDVEKYLKSIGLGPGYAWCQAFVYWCYQQAAAELKIKNPVPKTGGVLKHWGDTTAKKDGLPDRGDLFVMAFNGGLGHIGFVEKVEGDWIHTLEGNTNDDGSREGIGVFRRKRRIKDINRGFIEYL